MSEKPKVICGPCGQGFQTNDEFLDHKCEKADGFTPRDPEYVVKTTCRNFLKISESAKTRGSEKLKTK